MLSRRAAWIAGLALVVTVFAVYSPALNYQFILDDHRFTGDPRVRSSGHILEYFTDYAWSQFRGGPLSFYRPVFVLWLRLNFILNGMSSWGWHLLSIAKHVVVAALLGLLVWRLLRDRVAALAASALFALHPAQTESVAWVTVPDPLMAAAVLGTLLCYLKHLGRDDIGSYSGDAKLRGKASKQKENKSTASASPWRIFASAAACLAALMAKETAVVFPAVIFAVALTMPFVKSNARENAASQEAGLGARLFSALRETLPFLVVTLVYFLLRFHALKGQISPPTQRLPWKTVALSWPATLWFYVKVLLWPVRQRAYADPSLVETFILRSVLLPAFGVFCAAAVLAGGCFWGWRYARRYLPESEALGVRRAVLLGASLLVLPLLPALDLPALNPGDFLHGRYTYLPLAGLMLLLAVAWHLARNAPVVLLSAAVLLAVGFSALTITQEGMWKEDLTLFTVAHADAPNNGPVAQSLSRAHVQMALGFADAGRCDEAMRIFRQAIQQYSEDWYAWAGMGECLVQSSDLPGAEQALRRATELSGEQRVREQWQEVRSRMGLSALPAQ